jgi:2,5-diketo-D-gluconate reductase A
MTNTSPLLTLNNGVHMPALGLGVFQSPPEQTATAVMLRWHRQQGRSAIPKSTTPVRTAENSNVFDFELSSADTAAINALDAGIRRGPEPDAITLENYGKGDP